MRDLVAGTTDSRERRDGAETRATATAARRHFINDETRMAVSADGRFVAFTSDATNLVAGDTNGIEDVFVRDRRPPGSSPTPRSVPRLRHDGRTVGFDQLRRTPLVRSREPRTDGALGLRRRNAAGDRTSPTRHSRTPMRRPAAMRSCSPCRTAPRPRSRRDDRGRTAFETPALTLFPACAAPGDRIVASIAGVPLVPLAGGWNLADGPVPGVRAIHPSTRRTCASIRRAVRPSSGTCRSTPSPTSRRSRSRCASRSPSMPRRRPGRTRSTPRKRTGSRRPSPCPARRSRTSRRSAVVGGPYVGMVGVPVAFDGGASSDPEGAPLGYQWFFDDGGTAVGLETVAHVRCSRHVLRAARRQRRRPRSRRRRSGPGATRRSRSARTRAPRSRRPRRSGRSSVA